MILIRFTVIFLVVLGMYYIFVYRNLGTDTSLDTPIPTSMLYEGLHEYPYICYLPKGYGKVGKSFPLIVYMHHNTGGIQEGKYKVLNQSPVSYAVDQIDFPFVITAPIETSGEWDINKLILFLTHIQQKFYVDPNMIYLTGFHNGASSVWMVSSIYPSLFAAIAPVAGTGDPKSARHSLTQLPVWIFHGKRDSVVAVENSLLMVGALKDHNLHLNYTLYADKGHDIWQDVYNTNELYDWFLQFSLQSSP